MLTASSSKIVLPLLRWYDRNRRALPWRETGDPYEIWISEVMLQQTRVEVVLRFFGAFVARFPTVEHLARAREPDVLLAWAGLGYYSRARSLHRAARLVCELHGGRVPRTVDCLMELPGVGRYTAGAIASIAWGARVPAVDGNVARVLARLARIPGDASRVAAASWPIATRLVPPDRPGDFNQALMELGEVICRPASPDCRACPVARSCLARRAGCAELVPAVRKRSKRPEVFGVCGAIARGKRLLFVRRRSAGLLGGMWELPGAEVAVGSITGAAVGRTLKNRIGLHVVVGPRAGTVRHVFTHRALTLAVFECRAARGEVRLGDGYVEHAWMDPTRAAARLAMPALTRKVLASVGRPAPESRPRGERAPALDNSAGRRA